MKKGFTLIELLVVIAIIGLLATFAVVSFSGAQAKARDARTIADLKQIQKAIALCYDKIGSYLINSETKITTPCYREPLTDGDFVTSWRNACGEFLYDFPTPPAGGYNYVIHTSNDDQHYVLLAQMETSGYSMAEADVAAFVQSVGITGWTPCTAYDYVIGQ